MSKSTKPFAVRSITKSWHLYKAFAEELKILGYEVATHFNDFNYEMFKTRDCIYISNEWNNKPYPPSFTFSCTSGEVIVLETDWEKAIQTAKDFILEYGKPTILKLTSEYNAEINYKQELIKVGCQTISFTKVRELNALITKK
jgi:hypothetical protein